MQHRIRRGLAGKGVIRRNTVREQRAEIRCVEQCIEGCAAAMRHDIIIDTCVGKSLAQIAHAWKQSKGQYTLVVEIEGQP